MLEKAVESHLSLRTDPLALVVTIDSARRFEFRLDAAAGSSLILALLSSPAVTRAVLPELLALLRQSVEIAEQLKAGDAEFLRNAGVEVTDGL